MITIFKAPDRDFTILNLTDTHLTNEEWVEGHPFRRIFTTTVHSLIERVHPDMITITGDLTMVDNVESYEMLADFIEGFEIPWSIVWGNHDNENPPEVIAKAVESFHKRKHFLYESGDPALGNGNYVIKIEENGRPVTSLIMMDSHETIWIPNENGITERVYAKLIPEQLDWYREQVKQLKQLGYNESMLMMHIPIHAYVQAFAAAFNNDFDLNDVRNNHPEIFATEACWKDGYKESTGVYLEDAGCYPFDDGVFEVVKEMDHTRYIVSGHEHRNTFMIPYQGVKFIYSLKTGPSAYWQPDINGGTVIRISSNGICDVHHEFVDAQ